MKYGLYYFKNTHNLGDDMWAYAQSLFYPHIDYFIDNTSIYKFKSNNSEDVACIFAAFVEPYNCEYSFYPPKNIVPLFVGSYFRPTMHEFMNTRLIGSYLLEHAPIGCRTKELSEMLAKKGISAYFSGCISLTLPDLHKEKEDYICLVDVPEYVSDFVKNKVGNKFILKYITHDIYDIKEHSELPIEKRFEIIKGNLEIYAGAHCVITSRLHAALPCLTQNTPVLLTITNELAIGVNDIQRRVKDFFPMLNHNYYSDFLNDNVDYDFINPPVNPDLYLSYREDLIDRCKNFIEKCELGENSSHQISNDALLKQKDELIDILQEKVRQLKGVVDNKNSCITTLNEKNSTMKSNILTIQSRLRKYEVFNEWENIEYFGNWEERSFVMSKFIPLDCKSLLDLGCGEMHIRKFLPANTKYYGCDYKKRDSDTIICDLAKGEFPSLNVDTIFISGVLEYLVNWRDVLKKCSQHCNQIILSYSTTESAPKRDPIWVNSISSQELIEKALKMGFKLVGQDRFNTSDIFNFVKEC